ncbi:unnamed protein product [Urochloa humidicola]
MRKKPRAGGGGDRLSSLPDDLLGHILSLLPTQQAVHARQLSRRWRRVWPAHARALNLSVHDFPRRRSRLGALARGALARLLPALGGGGIPAISFELDRHADAASAWFREAMERASGSVRVSVPRGVSRLDLPLCTRAESLDLRLNHLLDLELPRAPADFGRLAELRLSMVMLPAGTPPLHEFLSASCPCLRALPLCCVRSRGDAVRLLAFRSDALEVLDLNNVDGLETVDVAAANLRSLSVRSCFRFPRDGHGGGEETEVVVSAPSMGAVCWYRSYPKRLTFLASMAHVRRLTGLKLPALGRSDQFDFPYTLQLLKACSLVQHLGLDLVIPDQMALLNWLGPGQQASCEDLLSYVPQLPNVSVASLTLSWGYGGNIIAPSLASFLSRLPNVTRLNIDSSPYCFTVLEAQGAVGPRGQYLRGDKKDDEKTQHLRLDSLREISVDGLKGTDRGECAVLELLLADAQLPSLHRVSLSFCDVSTPVVVEIAGEVRARFPMAAGRWTRPAPTVLAWTSSSQLQR